MARKTNKNPNQSRKLLALAIALGVVLIATGTTYTIKSRSDARHTAAAGKTTKPAARPGGAHYSTTPLDSTQVNAPNDTRKTSPGSSGNTTLSTPASNPNVSVTITNVTLNPSKVHTLVSGVTSGTCTLTATQAGHATVTASSSVSLNVNSYECQDFGLSPAQFASGHWHITVTLTSGGTTETSSAWDT